VKLLRVLEDRKVLRVGGRAPRRIDVRFVSATNRDLEAEIARGAFRQDLYFRLNGVSLLIPPLRERIAEIAPLARKFLADACWQLDQGEPPRIPREVLSFLEAYPWPGNVRELRNVIERAAVFCALDELRPSDLPEHLTAVPWARPADAVVARPEPPERRPEPGPRGDAPTLAPPPPGGDSMERLRLEMKTVERQRIVDALEQSAGNQTRAAKLLGMSLRTLINRIDEYGIPRPRKKP
jgi:DNA-binding NtrC family response regulator